MHSYFPQPMAWQMPIYDKSPSEARGVGDLVAISLEINDTANLEVMLRIRSTDGRTGTTQPWRIISPVGLGA